ncbi:MAG: ATP-binding cassette domain-containing protein [Rubritalea sp.]|uniref:phosphonate ABC transporter ATP-binding protein n=1 Tax=Rubritalea sp. TaxID=2109375 RepID=UPI003241E151
MIKLENANLSFGSTHALHNCELTIDKGEQIALIGPSGSGKSSLLRVLATEYRLDTGDYWLDSRSMRSLSSKCLKNQRCDIAYIPQDLALVPNLKVSQNVMLGQIGSTHLLGSIKDTLIPSTTKLNLVRDILQEVGIPEKLFHRTDSLSGGQQQRVAIARALYQEASLILADEPVSAVDPSRAHALLDCLTQMATKHTLTLICSLHNLEYAKTFFPRLVGMREGKVVFDGKSSDFTDKDFSALYQLDNG